MLAAAALAVAIAAPAALPAEPTKVAVTVDVSHRLGPVNRDLVGLGWTPGSGAAVADLHPRYVRVDSRLEQISTAPGAPLRLQPVLDEVAAIRAIGAEPVVILYAVPTWLGAPNAHGRDPTKVKPADLDAWEHVVHDVVRALATAPSPARRFEAWNEPDIPIFWQDTPSAWADTVERSGRAIARVERETGLDLAFGGPATAAPDPVYLSTFLERFRDPALPLDFVSWHWYANTPFLGPDGREPILPPAIDPAMDVVGRPNPVASPSSYGPQPGMMRSWANAALAGAHRTPPALFLDEWNLSAGGFDLRHDSHEGAAFAAGVLTELQGAGLDASAFFRAGDSYGHAGDWGVVRADGGRKPVWWTFWLWQRLAPQRVAVQESDDGLWAVAATAPGRVTLLLSSFSASQPKERIVDVDARGLASRTATVRRIDATHPSAAAVEPVRVAGGRVQIRLPAQSVAFLELTT